MNFGWGDVVKCITFAFKNKMVIIPKKWISMLLPITQISDAQYKIYNWPSNSSLISCFPFTARVLEQQTQLDFKIQKQMFMWPEDETLFDFSF